MNHYNGQNEVLDRITDAIFALNNNWEFTYMNDGAARLFRRRSYEMMGKYIWSEFPKEAYSIFYEHYRKAMQEQIRVEFEAYCHPISIWLEVKVFPSSDGLSVYLQDITQKKGLSLLKEQHYASLFKYNPDAVFAFDLEGNYLSVNPAMEQLLGYRAEEFLQMSYIPLIPPEELEKTKSLFKLAAKGITQHYETKAIHKNGKVIDVKVTNMPIIVNNESMGVFGVAKNIMQENQNKTKLLEAEKLTAVGQLAASIAHEIRNPLTSLKGFVHLIEQAVPGVNEKYFTIMKDELRRIELITSELLYLAKPQAQEFKVEQICQIVQDVSLLMSSQALMNNVEIRLSGLDGLPAIRCVAAQLKQVFINLIKNAMEAMPSGGVIGIHASSPSPETLMIQVSDTGKGIPQELIAKIGAPFYTTKENGTGLGMMATQQIIHSHGGTLDITSQVGEGTAIHICLPAASLQDGVVAG
ncbi:MULTISPECIES: PAS domain-containing sensor histidine kinase [unclassified Paenibacillus]|uniref:PAS domain-containing sensor histidine kinase n=1 Tax=unclassified Paenibacillus TaxID=185978 RepID=UPI0010485C45|nr:MULTISPECIES: PAS domain-containing sensor histidine kinase [unclassified Paenibacillus]NIK66909.1 two-component system, sporulation sensor kinase E [Paenibacillus sp. BK720]TCN00959.1 PAS domain S-box-containing protein [Paenibacillus sp. BK033]